MRLLILTILFSTLSLTGCSVFQTSDEPRALSKLIETPLYKFSEEELDRYLAYAQEEFPDLRERVIHIGRKNLGQPYALHLLGEFPVETYDSQPLYILEESDCVVFCEHTYAMALSSNWPEFFAMLQRIRYKEGQISVVTRNHYTEADWNLSNDWLVEDITEQLAGASAVEFSQTINLANFLEKYFDLQVDIESRTHVDYYVPWQQVAEIADELQPGDFVNVVRAKPGQGAYVGHTGLIAKTPDGTTTLLHSTVPEVMEEPLQVYIARSLNRGADNPEGAQLKGFKFLRLRETPLENLRRQYGADEPQFSAGPMAR